jgi:hypothetical protein
MSERSHPGTPSNPFRFVVVLLGGFATFAVVPSALGIYALVS